MYPLISGGNLEDRLVPTTEGQQRLTALGHPQPPPPLSWRELLRIVRDVTRALCYLHAQAPPVLHRDIKPSNILLDEQLNAKLADVGLAKQAHELQEGRTHLTTRNLVGTAGFIDPLYSNSGRYSAMTDAYAMGVVLLMCLMGKPAVRIMDEATDMLEEPEEAPQYVDGRAGWPAELAVAATKVVVGLSWARNARRRLPLADALTQLEALSDAANIRPGITDATQHARECVVCMSERRATRFGCGHASLCEACAAELQQRNGRCPNCRAPIRSVQRGTHISNEPTFISPVV